MAPKRRPGRNHLFVPGPTNIPDRVQRAMIEVSSRVIVVADHTKFTKSSLSVTAKIEDVGAIVTDVGAKSIIEAVPEKLRRKFIIASGGSEAAEQSA